MHKIDAECDEIVVAFQIQFSSLVGLVDGFKIDYKSSICPIF